MNQERADLIGTAHIFQHPAQVKLSTGKTINLHGVPLAATFGINAERELLRVAIGHYARFYAAIERGEIGWEGKLRLDYRQKAWLDQMETTCLLILTESLIKRRRGFVLGWISRIWAKSKAKKIMNGAIVEDWQSIIEQFNEHHDIGKITEAIFPDEAKANSDDPQKKSPTLTSGPESSSPSSTPSTRTLTEPTTSSNTSLGPESASSSESTPTNTAEAEAAETATNQPQAP